VRTSGRSESRVAMITLSIRYRSRPVVKFQARRLRRLLHFSNGVSCVHGDLFLICSICALRYRHDAIFDIETPAGTAALRAGGRAAGRP
jgi:hypothetical protein